MSGGGPMPDEGRDVTEFLGVVAGLAREKAWDQIAEKADAYLEGTGDSLRIRFVRAVAAYVMDDFKTALEVAERAFEDGGQTAETAEFIAILYLQTGRLTDALFYTKMTQALPKAPDIEACLPDDLPKLFDEFANIQEEPLLQRAVVAMAQGDWATAEHWFRQHLAVAPESREAYFGLCQCLFLFERFEEATEVLRGARHVFPWDGEIASLLGNALTSIGQFEEARACHRWAKDADAESVKVWAAAAQDMLLDPTASPQDLSTAYRDWGSRFGTAPAFGAPPLAAPAAKDRLTLGFVVAGMGRRSGTLGLADTLARMSHVRCRNIGFGFGALTDVDNIPFQKAFEVWHDIRHIDPLTVGSMVRAEGVDVLINVGGFASPEVLAGMGTRLAPVQMAWQNAPYGTGIGAVDYLISDDWLAAPGESGGTVRETLVSLGTGSVLVDLPTEAVPEVAREESPGPVFAADITLSELTPDVASAFARILHAVPDSVLLLRDHVFKTDKVLDRLISMFATFGVSHRVDVVSDADDVAFFAGADVALMPFPASRPGGAVSALWAGLPVVCLAGQARHARQTSSVLHYAGLGDETVVDSVDAFIGAAVGWAGDAARRDAFAKTVRDRLTGSAVADAKARAAALETIVEDAWRKVCAS